MIQPSSEERTCANHPDLPAVAVCSLCSREICIHCHSVALNGYAVCRGCPVADDLRPKTKWEAASGVLTGVHGFFYTAVEVLSGPRKFFTERPYGKATYAIGFGYLALLIGTFFGVLWNSLFLAKYAELVEEVSTQLSVSVDVVRTLNFVTVPFKAGLVLVVHTVTLFLGLRIVGGPQVNIRDVSHISGYALAGFMFLLIPPVLDYPIGHLLAVVWVFHAEFTAAQTRYDLGFFKSMIAIIIPYFLLYSLSA